MSDDTYQEPVAQQARTDTHPDPDAIVEFATESEEFVAFLTETLETSDFLSTSLCRGDETLLLIEEVDP